MTILQIPSTSLRNYSNRAPIPAYRLVEMKQGHPHTLFHALPINGKRTRRLPLDTWIQAEIKPVTYGRTSPFMDSGFNVLLDRGLAEDYLRRFTADRRVAIVECQIKGLLREKPRATSPVVLAEWMMIPSSQFTLHYQHLKVGE